MTDDSKRGPSESPAFVGVGRSRMAEVFVGGVGGVRPAVPVAFAELAEAARRAMSAEAWAYVAGGAGSETSASTNRQAFERWRVVPRMLAGVESVDLSVELFGRTLPAPVVLSPVGVLELAHPEADLAVARAASRLGLPMIFSNQASHSMESCSQVMGESPRWFQLYWSTSDELVQSFLRRAEDCGCEALVLTLDTSVLGWRPRDLDLAELPFLRGMGLAQYFEDPVFRASLDEPLDLPTVPPKPPLALSALAVAVQQILRFPGTWKEKLSGRPRTAVQRFLATYSRPSLRWEDLAWLREQTKLPLVLKGILHADDARRALDHGADGLLMANHGGRQVDGSIASLEALPKVVEVVGGRVPVLLDSGVRSGADVFKALALGADAVGIGRPWVYGLAAGGETGVHETLHNLVAELEVTTVLAGYDRVADIDRGALVDAGEL